MKRSPLMQRVVAALNRACDETGAFQKPVLPPACAAASSLDDLHPAFSQPVTGYMSRTGYELLHVRSGWWTKFCLDRTELNPRGGVVEVEVRLRRVIEP
jgi:hypothetical protein